MENKSQIIGQFSAEELKKYLKRTVITSNHPLNYPKKGANNSSYLRGNQGNEGKFSFIKDFTRSTKGNGENASSIYTLKKRIFFNNNLVWELNLEGVFNPQYIFEMDRCFYNLSEALRHTSDDFPVRGPNKYVKGIWKYNNEFSGDVNRFMGTEQEMRNENILYSSKYFGGILGKTDKGFNIYQKRNDVNRKLERILIIS